MGEFSDRPHLSSSQVPHCLKETQLLMSVVAPLVSCTIQDYPSEDRQHSATIEQTVVVLFAW